MTRANQSKEEKLWCYISNVTHLDLKGIMYCQRFVFYMKSRSNLPSVLPHDATCHCWVSRLQNKHDNPKQSVKSNKTWSLQFCTSVNIQIVYLIKIIIYFRIRKFINGVQLVISTKILKRCVKILLLHFKRHHGWVGGKTGVVYRNLIDEPNYKIELGLKIHMRLLSLIHHGKCKSRQGSQINLDPGEIKI